MEKQPQKKSQSKPQGNKRDSGEEFQGHAFRSPDRATPDDFDFETETSYTPGQTAN